MRRIAVGDKVLAHESSVTDETIRKWKNCQSRPKQENYEKIVAAAKFLRLTLQEEQEFLKTAFPDVPMQKHCEPIPGHPIERPEQFFGREVLLRWLLELWTRLPLQPIAITGAKCTGKSSLLHYLNTMKFKELPDYRIVLAEFQNILLHKRDGILRHLLNELTIFLPQPLTLENFIYAVGDNLQQPTIILLDDVDIALNAPELDQEFWTGLRSLTLHVREDKLTFLITCEDAPEYTAHSKGQSSPFFNIFLKARTLTAFETQEAEEFLTCYQEILNKRLPKPVALTEADRQWILTESQCWPALLQICCDAHWDAVKDRKSDNCWKTEATNRFKRCQHLLRSTAL
jgi:hypothetical protein